MQKLVCFLIATFILVSCSRTNVKKEKYEDGRIKSEKTFQKINGKEQLVKEVKFHQNGQKYIEGSYKDELRNGPWSSWYEDGKIWSKGEFKEGKSHGKRTVYHPNGNIYYEGNFDMGKRTGLWVFFDENGVKIKEVNYNNTQVHPNAGE